MTGFGRLRARWGRARMAIGKCGELRRHGPVGVWSGGAVFRRGEQAPPGPSFGSWF
ncbi:hypothetical protein O1R50_24625 [Glycomyces luteolus]|uniref:Uncharacterized protein n=1 Tax=Glycomyces luteolus TaxID=2670330 RepID=A0A9X3PPP2_9ACTN|nr:hypothetical protein [Glycomyces luteolus]MDA1362825.1 hypothetical protein [Glycomyces luteolus]